jgi:Carboxypeptidase regulatory-like domain
VVTRLVFFAFLLSAQDGPPDLCQLFGSVVNSITGEPLNHVRLFAEAVEGGPTARTASDAKGNFTLIDLKPGRYRLHGARNGYIDMYYGARRPDSKGTPITLAPGQRLEDVKFKLMPFAVIAGTVRESDGEPISGASITLLRLYHQAEGSSLERAETAETDDLGQFRIPNLPPGTYFARASPSLSSPDESGEDHGGKDTPRETLVGVTYGGSRDLAGARPIEVEPGARIGGIDFTLPRSRIFHLRGHVTAPAGTDARVWLSSGGVNDRDGESFRAALNANGDFDIPGIPTGSHTLWADARKRKADQPADGRMYIDLYQPLRAALPVEVADRDIEGLRITVEDGAEIAGHITVIDEEDVKLSSSQVFFHGVYENNPGAYVKPNQTFSLTLAPGHYEVLLQDSGASKKRVIRSIRSADVDVLRDGLTIQGPGAVPLEIVLAPDAGELDGAALDKDENPAPGATVVAIPDPMFRKRSERFFSAGADQQGRFQMKGMPPGSYKLFAWEDVEPDAWFDPEFLRPIESRGEPVKIQSKGSASVKLHLIQ